MPKATPSPARRLVGKTVRYEYSTPAVSCCSSRRIQVEGVVTCIRHNPSSYFGRNTLIVRTDDSRNYVALSEVTHTKDNTGRWRQFKVSANKNA
jgi:hypothetical protein